jgi:AcrR family transcriptional regulator
VARKYNSRNRTESAERTRQSIIEVAVEMHGKGITTLSAVAEAAGVSLPTVNKYFPTREALFDACTRHFTAALQFPSLELLMAVNDPGERLRQVVYEIYRLHEATLGQSWTGYKLADESPVLAQGMAAYETAIAQIAEAILYDRALQDRETVSRFVYAALSPLTYRALRLTNGLSLDTAVKYMTTALAAVLNIEV